MRFILLVVLLAACTMRAQEKVMLTTPVPAATEYQIVGITLRWAANDRCSISVTLNPNAGESISHSYSGAPACVMLRALNKADLSTVSLQRRILNQLITDKVIAGTVEGSPE